MSGEDRILLQAGARDHPGRQSRHPGRADQPSSRGNARAALRAEPAAARRAAQRRGCTRRRADLPLRNRHRRLQRRRPRVRDHAGAGRRHAGAVGQRAGQPALRHRGLRERQRATPGARTRTNSASRRGTTTRSATPAARRSTCATRRPASSGRRRRCRRAAAAATSPATASATACSSTTRTASTRELWIYVALDAPVKFSVLKLRNASGAPRRLSVTGYVEWVLGDLRERTAMHVVTESDPASGALFARNAYNTEFPTASRSSTCDDPARGIDRRPRANSSAATAAPRRPPRWGAHACPAGSARDSIRAPRCRCGVTLADGEQRELIFRLGLGRDAADASALVQRFRGSGTAARGAAKPCARTGRARSARCRCSTPDPALDVLANGWLLYQTLACRIWARSGYYQSGGAFGFRDQLQDVDGAGARRAGTRARAAAAVRRAPVPRGRRAALVASAARVAACAPPAPTTTCGCRWRPAATCWPPATPACWTQRVRLPRRPPAASGRGVLLRPAATARRCSETLYEHCVRAIEHGLPLRRARPAADRLRRLERRHEPGRRGRPRRERVARLLPLRGADALRRRGAAARRRGVRRLRCDGEVEPAARSARAARLGRRLVSPRVLRRRHAARLQRATTNARSIRSRRAGRCCPAPAAPERRRRR